MFRFTLSTSVLMTAMSLLTASVSAQGFGLVQNDYDRYAQLFKTGNEPNLSHHPTEGSETWRKLYRDHNWKGYAEKTERREPLLAAQVLMGIYLTQYVDHQLSYQIENIVLDKPLLSATLAENSILARIATYMNSDPEVAKKSAKGGLSFYTEDDLKKMVRQGVDLTARKKITAAVPRNFRTELVSVQNLFRQRESGWGATYYFMREKFLVLDALRDSFRHSADMAPERRENLLNKIMETDTVKRMANERIRSMIQEAKAAAAGRGNNSEYSGEYDYDESGNPIPSSGAGGLSPSVAGMSEMEIEELRLEMPRTIAEEIIKAMDTRNMAHKYIVGIYQSSDFHLGTLEQIHSYYLRAAEQGDPIAQYHLALFLRYLGDIVGEDKGTAEHESQEWLHKAATSDVTRKRVEELNLQFVAAERKMENRARVMQDKIETLVRLENEKIDMIHEVLVKIAERASQYNEIKQDERRTEQARANAAAEQAKAVQSMMTRDSIRALTGR